MLVLVYDFIFIVNGICFMHWYFNVLRKYGVFSGRSRRKEYWYFSLFNFIFYFVIAVVDTSYTTIFLSIFTLFIIIPSIAVTIRRLHDVGYSGFWILLFPIPIIGLFLSLFILTKDGVIGSNKYGENPKGINSLLK